MEILFSRRASIDGIVLDASISENHNFGGDSTQHPVEEGSDITDHYRPRQRAFTIEGIVSNTPIQVPESNVDGVALVGFEHEFTVGTSEALGPVSDLTGLGGAGLLGAVAGAAVDLLGLNKRTVVGNGFDPAFDRVGDVFLELDRLGQTGELVTIVTTLATYENMTLNDVSIVRNAENGNVLRFSASAKQQRIVTTETALAPVPKIPEGNPKNPKGKQPVKPSNNSEEGLTSTAAQILDGAIGGL